MQFPVTSTTPTQAGKSATTTHTQPPEPSPVSNPSTLQEAIAFQPPYIRQYYEQIEFYDQANIPTTPQAATSIFFTQTITYLLLPTAALTLMWVPSGLYSRTAISTASATHGGKHLV